MSEEIGLRPIKLKFDEKEFKEYFAVRGYRNGDIVTDYKCEIAVSIGYKDKYPIYLRLNSEENFPNNREYAVELWSDEFEYVEREPEKRFEITWI